MDKKTFITILIANNYQIQQRGIEAIINEQADMDVVGKMNDDKTTIEMIKEHKPDVVLTDCIMPECSEKQCAKLIANAKQSKIIILSNVTNIHCALRIIKLGAAGYLLKDCKSDEIVEAVRIVCSGETYLSKKLSRQLTNVFSQRQSSQVCNQLEQLSARESEIVSFIAMGYLSGKIVQTLNIQLTTLRTYRKRIRKKLGINNDAELTKLAIRSGLASLY